MRRGGKTISATGLPHRVQSGLRPPETRCRAWAGIASRSSDDGGARSRTRPPSCRCGPRLSGARPRGARRPCSPPTPSGASTTRTGVRSRGLVRRGARHPTQRPAWSAPRCARRPGATHARCTSGPMPDEAARAACAQPPRARQESGRGAVNGGDAASGGYLRGRGRSAAVGSTTFREVWQRTRLFELDGRGGAAGPCRVGCGRSPRPTLDLVAAPWYAAFHRDSDEQAGRAPGPLEPPVRARHAAPGAGSGRTFFWEDPQLVTPVHLTGSNPHQASVWPGSGRCSPRPSSAGRGWASAAVHAVSARAAGRSGARVVVLFTDLANPTSNALYARLGFHAGGRTWSRLVVERTGAAGHGAGSP